MAVLLEVQNISKHFGGLKAINEVSMKVKQGEILGIIGPNGAGKTTFFNLIRQTITGEWDDLFKSLIEMFEKKHINDDDYFQKYLKAHLDRGARMIYSEFKYSGDFVMALLKKDTTI